MEFSTACDKNGIYRPTPYEYPITGDEEMQRQYTCGTVYEISKVIEINPVITIPIETPKESDEK